MLRDTLRGKGNAISADLSSADYSEGCQESSPVSCCNSSRTRFRCRSISKHFCNVEGKADILTYEKIVNRPQAVEAVSATRQH